MSYMTQDDWVQVNAGGTDWDYYGYGGDDWGSGYYGSYEDVWQPTGSGDWNWSYYGDAAGGGEDYTDWEYDDTAYWGGKGRNRAVGTMTRAIDWSGGVGTKKPPVFGSQVTWRVVKEELEQWLDGCELPPERVLSVIFGGAFYNHPVMKGLAKNSPT